MRLRVDISITDVSFTLVMEPLQAEPQLPLLDGPEAILLTKLSVIPTQVSKHDINQVIYASLLTLCP